MARAASWPDSALLALAGAGAMAAAGRSATTAEPVGSTVAFYGEHQAGITTAAQDRLHFASFDEGLAALRGVLRAGWRTHTRPIADAAQQPLRVLRGADADPPGLAVGVVAQGVDVAADVEEAVADAPLAQHGDGAGQVAQLVPAPVQRAAFAEVA